MKTIDAILISVTVGLLLIFVDQVLRLKHSLGDSYFILMLAMCSYLLLRYLRQKRKLEQQAPPQKEAKGKKGK